MGDPRERRRHPLGAFTSTRHDAITHTLFCRCGQPASAYEAHGRLTPALAKAAQSLQKLAGTPQKPVQLVNIADDLYIYTKAFGHGPIVFGAISSLHAATSICCGLFVTRRTRGYEGLGFVLFYCSGMVWLTQYLHHHFTIELLCGTFYSLVSFTLFERCDLRRNRSGTLLPRFDKGLPATVLLFF